MPEGLAWRADHRQRSFLLYGRGFRCFWHVCYNAYRMVIQGCYKREGIAVDLKFAEYIIALDEERNVTRAAKKLGMSQGALSNFLIK